jgi:hypothetical protein
MNCKRASARDETAFAAHAAIPAVHRKSLAASEAAPYSSVQRSTTNRRKDRTMKTTSTQVRVLSFLAAVLMSASVLGATVTGMQASAKVDSPQVVVLDRATVSATSVN